MSNITMPLSTSRHLLHYGRYTARAPLFPGSYRKASPFHRYFTSEAVVEENDIVLLRKTRDHSASPILTKSLTATGRDKWEMGRRTDSIESSHIIGKKLRDTVISKKGEFYRIHKPTLGEYVNFCPRIVTPIYPADANLIVSLLDINLPQYDENSDNTTPFEIFEAGTGHGGLTLHLARAIHGANPPILQKAVSPAQTLDVVESNSSKFKETFSTLMEDVLGKSFGDVSEQNIYASKRRAIIQTLDISASHSGFAKKVVKNYNNGMYFRNIDFHVGTIESYLSSRLHLHDSEKPFLEHVILDLPSTHDFLEIVAKALKPNGTFIAFCPSITQINSCVLKIKKDNLPFWLESVLEIGPGAGVGGRPWDIRAIKPRALVRAEEEAAKKRKDSAEREAIEATALCNEADVATEEAFGLEGEKNGEEYDWELICRPKVGDRVIGGGFIAVFKCKEW